MLAFSSDLVRAIPGFCQPVSSLSHIAAAAVALVGGVPLIRLARGCRLRTAAVAVYVFCVVATLAISGTYHAMTRGCVARDVLQRMDHFAIWLLIAGTFTAVHGIMFSGAWRRGVLTFIWGYAAVAASLQLAWFDVFSGLPGLVLYLGLGWVGLFSIFKLGRRLGFAVVTPVWGAGIAYTAGALLERGHHYMLFDQSVGPHEVFHGAVIVGVALHWFFIRRLLLVHAPALAAPVAAPALPAVAA